MTHERGGKQPSIGSDSQLRFKQEVSERSENFPKGLEIIYNGIPNLERVMAYGARGARRFVIWLRRTKVVEIPVPLNGLAHFNGLPRFCRRIFSNGVEWRPS